MKDRAGFKVADLTFNETFHVAISDRLTELSGQQIHCFIVFDGERGNERLINHVFGFPYMWFLTRQ
ncbi:hypothetical protein [Poriferisphaera sp. WC338]|uniref:hypothetical protein n=1 Tax=Poriferisphaera sp. WC338 TaxID=3425129 RepID=UPI003D819E74